MVLKTPTHHESQVLRLGRMRTFLPTPSPSLETAQIPQILSRLGETPRSLALSSPPPMLPVCLEEKVWLSAGRTTEARDSWPKSWGI